jgi:hypothetical protein
MDEETKKLLQKMSTEEREKRFRELRQKMGLARPVSISGGRTKPPETTLEENEEYQFLKNLLGYK